MGTVAIIGAGPAGLIAAEHLAGLGHMVTIHERMPSPARKFLLAGRGGLNLTHTEPFERFLTRYPNAPPMLLDAIGAFPPVAVRAHADGLGQETFEGTSGRVFPKAFKASPLLRAWLARLDGLGVTLRTRSRFRGFCDKGEIILESEAGESRVHTHATLLCMGGASWPRLGTDGGWAEPLRAAGIPVTPLAPANCGLVIPWSAMMVERFQGAALKRIALSFEGETVRGEAMITRAGLEGGPVYALSGRVRDALAAGRPATLQLDLRPDQTMRALTEALSTTKRGESLATLLTKRAKLTPGAAAILREATGNVVPREPAALAALIKSVPLTPIAVSGLDRAISTAGGVPFAALAPDFSTLARPDVFVAGEMLDWEAPTGGYLLTACLATGMAAARGMAARLGAP
jgi:uncharacterized flavoprotein (TIGR03862 family)